MTRQSFSERCQTTCLGPINRSIKIGRSEQWCFGDSHCRTLVCMVATRGSRNVCNIVRYSYVNVVFRALILSLGQMAVLTDIIAKGFHAIQSQLCLAMLCGSELFIRRLLCYHTDIHPPNGDSRSARCAVLCSPSTGIAS